MNYNFINVTPGSRVTPIGDEGRYCCYYTDLDYVQKQTKDKKMCRIFSRLQ